MKESELEAKLSAFTARVIRETNGSQSYAPAFNILYEVATDILSAKKMTFWKYSSSDSSFYCDYMQGTVKTGVKRGDKIGLDSPVAEFILGQISHRTKFILADDIRKLSPGADLVERETLSCYFLPLFFQTHLLGLFCFETTEKQINNERVGLMQEYVDAVALYYSALRREARGTKRLMQMRLLHQIAERALMRVDLKDILTTTAKLLKNYFLYYNVYIFLYRPDEEALELSAVAGAYADKLVLPPKISTSKGCIGEAFRTRTTYYCKDARTDPYYLPEIEGDIEAISELAVPIAQGNNILGVLDVQADAPNSFDQFDIESMETLASEIASAIIRAYDYKVLKNYSKQLEVYKQQMEHDLRISEQIISMNLPIDFSSPYVGAHLHFKAHRSIGGDIVFLKSAETYSYVIVGDVSGHGIGSALVSTSAYSFFINILNTDPPTETLVQSFNDFWLENFKDVGYYATIFVGRLHNLTGSFEYINCAHPSPLVYQVETGNLITLERNLPPIGLFDLDSDADIQRKWIKLKRDDKVFLYTDGLLKEYPPPSKLTDDDLRRYVIQLGIYPPPIAHQLLLKALGRATKGVAATDDEVLVTFAYTASPSIGGYIESIEDTISLLRKVNSIVSTVAIPAEVLDAVSGLLEETALALLARKKESKVTPRLFILIDFLPKKFIFTLLDANQFLRDENLLDTHTTIPQLEDQLPTGTLKLIKNRLKNIEIKKIDKGLLFVRQFERALSQLHV